MRSTVFFCGGDGGRVFAIGRWQFGRRGLVTILAALVLLVGVGSGSWLYLHRATGHGPVALRPTPSATATPSPAPSAAPAATPSPAAAAVPPDGVHPARLVIPKLTVDAKVENKGIDKQNQMEVPDDPNDVAWYTFTSLPGGGSNAVFAGHLDWTTGPAVFQKLKDLQPGDAVQVKDPNGATVTYKVTESHDYSADTAPVAQIIGKTPKDTVTLITCSGSFSRSRQAYTNRLIVKGERVS